LSFKGAKRSYSIANAKSLSSELELHIRKVQNSKMSDLLFGEIQENQLMRLEGPKGTFFVKEDDKPVILIVLSTGIAPVKVIVEELLAKKISVLLMFSWGCSIQRDIQQRINIVKKRA